MRGKDILSIAGKRVQPNCFLSARKPESTFESIAIALRPSGSARRPPDMCQAGNSCSRAWSNQLSVPLVTTRFRAARVSNRFLRLLNHILAGKQLGNNSPRIYVSSTVK